MTTLPTFAAFTSTIPKPSDFALNEVPDNEKDVIRQIGLIAHRRVVLICLLSASEDYQRYISNRHKATWLTKYLPEALPAPVDGIPANDGTLAVIFDLLFVKPAVEHLYTRYLYGKVRLVA